MTTKAEAPIYKDLMNGLKAQIVASYSTSINEWTHSLKNFTVDGKDWETFAYDGLELRFSGEMSESERHNLALKTFSTIYINELMPICKNWQELLSKARFGNISDIETALSRFILSLKKDKDWRNNKNLVDILRMLHCMSHADDLCKMFKKEKCIDHRINCTRARTVLRLMQDDIIAISREDEPLDQLKSFKADLLILDDMPEYNLPAKLTEGFTADEDYNIERDARVRSDLYTWKISIEAQGQE